MSTYRLDPIDPLHPVWKGVPISKAIFVGASDPWLARSIAANRLLSVPIAEASYKIFSPWLDDKQSTCELEPNLEMPDNEIRTVDGEMTL